MKKLVLCFTLLICILTVNSQITTSPSFIEKGYQGEIKIIFNPNEGNKGMSKADRIYLMDMATQVVHRLYLATRWIRYVKVDKYTL